jgi:hypothetical protein
VNDTHTFFWLVGVFEGEAYFGYSTGKRTPRIEVEMKDEHVIARIASLFSVGYSRRDRRHNRPETSITYRVTLTGRRAMQVMKRVQPYMSPRRARAIQQVDERYRESRSADEDYSKFPLPPLMEVPYIVER